MQVVVGLLGNLNGASQGRKESITSSMAGGKLKERCGFVSTDVQYWHMSGGDFFSSMISKIRKAVCYLMVR